MRRRYGAREVRHLPGSAEPRPESTRYLSAHSDTERTGSGRSPARHVSTTNVRAACSADGTRVHFLADGLRTYRRQLREVISHFALKGRVQRERVAAELGG
jgi:hypothetical protein